VASVLDYEPVLDGGPYDPTPFGGSVERLRLYAEPTRSGVPVVDVGPAAQVTSTRWRFTFSTPVDATYYAVVTWRETATAEPFQDADEVVVFPLATRQPYQVTTGAALAAVVGNRYPRASLDEAASVVSGLIEGWTRGRSVNPGDVPRDLVAVATAAALRLAPNLPQIASVSVEGQSFSGGAFRGFTLHEQLILNRYRRRSA
jgi:hypothetical protein